MSKRDSAAGRHSMIVAGREKRMVNRSCTTCVYAWWDQGHWLTSLSTGFPSRPVCANHPDSLGRMRPVSFGTPCRNYRPKLPEPEGGVKRIPLGGGLYAYVDAADYEWLSQWAWHVIGGYAGRYEKDRKIYIHREIVQPRKGLVVDHINRNKMDNTRLNLRACTPDENARNRAKRVASVSQYKGVGYRKRNKKWFAEIAIAGEHIWLGFCDSEIDAARTYDRAAVEHFGEFANLNFPEEWPPQRRQEVYANGQAALKKKGKKVGRKEAKGDKSSAQTKTSRRKSKANRKPHPARRSRKRLPQNSRKTQRPRTK
jgi:hypothetical protein